jgi:flap endonuclease-1
MVKEKGFSEDRIRKGCEKMTKNLKQATQTRVQDFFKVTSSTSSITIKKVRQSAPSVYYLIHFFLIGFFVN